MTTGREVDPYAGYGRGDQKTFTIPSGADGSLVAPVDFGRAHAWIVVECTDASGIAAATTLSLEAAFDSVSDVVTILQADIVGSYASVALPTSGDFSFLITHGLGFERLRLILSNNTSAPVTFTVYALDTGTLGGVETLTAESLTRIVETGDIRLTEDELAREVE